MYFTWRTERINAKTVLWGPSGVGTTSTIHALAGRVDELVEAGEAEAPGPEQAVGMRRNHRPVEVDEEDRKLTAYFFHPPGRAGEFDGFPLHHKWVAPEGEIEGNTAYAGVFDGVSAVVLTLDARRERQAANRESVERLAGHLARRFDVEAPTTSGVLAEVTGGDEAPGEVALVIQVNRVGAEEAVAAEDLVRTLRLPSSASVVTTEALTGESVWPLVGAVREALEPRLRAAKEVGRIPEV